MNAQVSSISRDREGGPPVVAAGALQLDQAHMLVFQQLAHAVKVDSAALEQVSLLIADAVVLKRPHARLAADADDLFHRVVGLASGRQQHVARPQHAVQAQRQRVRARGNLRAHDCRLAAHQLRPDVRQVIAADVVVAVAGRGRKVPGRHPVGLEGLKNPHRVVPLDFVQSVKAGAAVLFRLVHQQARLFAIIHLNNTLSRVQYPVFPAQAARPFFPRRWQPYAALVSVKPGFLPLGITTAAHLDRLNGLRIVHSPHSAWAISL